MLSSLYSIGYAAKSEQEFITLLKQNKIDCLIDVRSAPYSTQFPEFNAENLKMILKDVNISYLLFSEEFGARRNNPEDYSLLKLYDGTTINVVDFQKVWCSSLFLEGYNRVINGLSKGFNICFMCSEKYPYDCHRGIMVSEFFYRKGYEIFHLIDRNTIIKHSRIYAIDEIKDYFEKCKKIFLNKYSSDLFYSYDLFEGKIKELNENVKYWQNFFDDFNNNKLIQLINYKIGYKKEN